MAQRDQSTLAYESATNPFLKPPTQQTFIDTILSKVPEFPDYYRKMKKLVLGCLQPSWHRKTQPASIRLFSRHPESSEVRQSTRAYRHIAC
jgi:hypothetical protein